MEDESQTTLFPENPVEAAPTKTGYINGAPRVRTPIEVPFGIALLALGSVSGLGTKGVGALCSAFGGDLGLAWSADDAEMRGILSKAKVPGVDRIINSFRLQDARLLDIGQEKMSRLTESGVTVLPRYELPQTLLSIPDPPQWLFVQGNPEALFGGPVVAVVGTREPSPQGVNAAGVVARMLSTYDITLVSGLANGIDEAAHSASLRAGTRNVAFLGHGINVWFPEETTDTRRRIVAQDGAVASEYLPDDHYKRHYFVARNRLQAGLADLLIPVEANPQGGTAHTVRFAKEYGKPIIGIKWPGSNGMAAELEAQSVPVVDIRKRDELKALDTRLQGLLDKYNKDFYSLRTAEQILLQEAASRAVSKKDAARLLKAVRDFVKEVRTHRGT